MSAILMELIEVNWRGTATAAKNATVQKVRERSVPTTYIYHELKERKSVSSKFALTADDGNKKTLNNSLRIRPVLSLLGEVGA